MRLATAACQVIGTAQIKQKNLRKGQQLWFTLVSIAGLSLGIRRCDDVRGAALVVKTGVPDMMLRSCGG